MPVTVNTSVSALLLSFFAGPLGIDGFLLQEYPGIGSAARAVGIGRIALLAIVVIAIGCSSIPSAKHAMPIATHAMSLLFVLCFVAFILAIMSFSYV